MKGVGWDFKSSKENDLIRSQKIMQLTSSGSSKRGGQLGRDN